MTKKTVGPDVFSEWGSSNGIPSRNGSSESYVGSDNSHRHDLANALQSQGYHPVLIFGTQASGKSSLLASLFHHLQSDPDSPAIAIPGGPLLPLDTAYGKEVHDQALHFFNTVVDNFFNGEAAPRTSDEAPYYIPVVLRPNNGQPEVKIAFLESRGEWYHINRESRTLYPELRGEVDDVYRRFTGALSILLVAPLVIGDVYEDEGESEFALAEQRNTDSSLFGALQSYQSARGMRDLDQYLFVLTKWDAYTKGLSSDEFSSPPEGVVDRLIESRYPRAWQMFRAMQQRATPQAMRYCSGIMSGNVHVPTPHHLRHKLSPFPRRLWNWLYSNATNGRDLSETLPNYPKDRATPTVESLDRQVLRGIRKFLS